MKNNIENGLKEIWDIKEALYNDFVQSDFNDYYEFIKNEIKDLNYTFFLKEDGIINDAFVKSQI